MTAFSSLKEAEAITGGLSKPSKMPGYAYGLPAKECKTGAKLAKIKDSVCSKCYALKGRYAFPAVQNAQYQRLKAIRHPRWVEAMAYQINTRKCDYFRWHDSGDIQDVDHLMRIVEVAEKCPGTKFWLPTREKQFVRDYQNILGAFPENLCVRVSATMIDGPVPLGFVNTSQVLTDKSQVSCHASLNSTSCGDCRACWDPKVANVSYKKH